MRSFSANGRMPVRLLVASFFVLITLGAVALRSPWATPADAPITWTDATFTATSAACVTGLTVRDTGTGFTPFGQGVILALIQLGGLGVMTFSLLLVSLVSGRLPLAARSVIEQSLTTAGRGQLLSLLAVVFRFTLACEALGALILTLRFAADMPWGQAAWFGVFHAVSAFCNAGFGLLRDSLVSYQGDWVVNLVVMVEVVLGGLGFLVVHELLVRRGRRRLGVHTRLVLTVSAVLTLGGALAIFLLERRYGLAELPVGVQALASLFQSVTTRTAGFNTVTLTDLAPETLFLMVILMFIGGSPGSTAGGIKTTTVGVLAATAWSRLRGRSHVNLYRRTLREEAERNALAITLLALLVVVGGLLLLLFTQEYSARGAEGRSAFFGYLFETVSALGTVGLSLGVTETLTPGSRWVVAGLMFFGRLGTLTIAAALSRPTAVDDWSYPEEDVMLG